MLKISAIRVLGLGNIVSYFIVMFESGMHYFIYTIIRRTSLILLQIHSLRHSIQSRKALCIKHLSAFTHDIYMYV